MTHPLTQVVLTVSSCRLLLAAFCLPLTASCLTSPPCRSGYCPDDPPAHARGTDCLLLPPPARCLLLTAYCLLPYEPSLAVGATDTASQAGNDIMSTCR